MDQITARESEQAPHKHTGNADDPEYDAWIVRMQALFVANVEGGKVPLFTTTLSGRQPEGTKDLFEIYLDGFRVDQRQFHNCAACRHFIRTFGSLVVIDDNGRTRSAFWGIGDAPEAYHHSVAMVMAALRRAPVTGVFISAESTWGQPVTGAWHHLSLIPPPSMVHKRRDLTPFQLSAEKLHDYQNVGRALGEYKPEHVDQAVTLLKSEQLYRSEKVLGPAEWLQKLHQDRAAVQGNGPRENILWLAVAKAPTGFCHPRSSMVGTLLDDISGGKSFEEASRAFAAKMHPLLYQRPQAAPSAGAVKQAEDLFEKMGLGPALNRRFARLEDVVAVWRPEPPKEAAKPSGGLFSHLKTKEEETKAAPMRIPPTTMTWLKFSTTVLPDAAQIESMAPPAGNYTALVTACDPGAQRLLQWDRDEIRNPVSWYVYHGGSLATEFGLLPSQWTNVTAITLQPNQWHEPQLKHQGEGVLFILEGARDKKLSGGLGLFPECLRSELHGVRSVIEAHSRSQKLAGAEEASACGLIIQRGARVGGEVHLRVTSKAGAVQEYRIDRLD